MLTVGTISCKAFQPLLYSALMFNTLISLLTLAAFAVGALILYKVYKQWQQHQQ